MPFLRDGTPMPTRFWLVGKNERVAVSRLETVGGVRPRSEAEIRLAHRRSPRALRAGTRRALPADHAGPRPAGGVGGTRVGVKCLHAHYAWYLAGGDDPVGRWVADHLGGEGELA